MRYLALAVDYDGTAAVDDRLTELLPLTRVAQLIAGLACEIPANVRRLVATDTVRLVDQA